MVGASTPADAIRAVVVDDTVLYRMLVTEGVDRVPGFRVVGQAADGAAALRLIDELQPQLLLLDLEMPVLDGMQVLETLRRRRRQIHTLLISAQSTEGARITLEALQLGAFDFITKPAAGGLEQSRRALFGEIAERLETLRGRLRPGTGAPPRGRRSTPAPPPAETAAGGIREALRAVAARRVDAVGIGISTGGPQALPQLLPALGSGCPPVLVVQHMPATFLTALARKLDALAAVEVVEAADGMPLGPGRVYVAPGGVQLGVRRRGLRGEAVLREDPPENHCRPAADYLFRALAAAYGGSALGMVMTGMGGDGAAGLLAMRRSGALTLAQDEASSTVYGMPRRALELGAADCVLSLDQLRQVLGALGR